MVNKKAKQNGDGEASVSSSQGLVNKINEVMRKKGHNRHDLTDQLQISYIHLNSLMGGIRNFTGLNIEKQRLLASYLGISFAQYYIYLGILTPDDFFIQESFDQRAQLTFDKMYHDPLWSSTMPKAGEMADLPHSVKLLVVLMYEHISKESLLEKMDLPDFSGKKSQ